MIRTHTITLLVGVAALACNSDSTQPLGPPDHLVRSGGDQQNWYFNNPLPLPYSVKVVDANNRPVPGVSVAWSILLGAGTFSSNPSTTNSSGVATTIHTLGTATRYVVNVIVAGVPTTQFTAQAAAPGTAVGVSVTNNLFTPKDTAVQTGGTVTWTWNSGVTEHNVTYTGGPTTPLPDNSLNQSGTTTFSTPFTTVGKYTYHCTNHPTQMTGSVTVVH